MTLLLPVDAEVAAAVLIGDIVHIRDESRPDTRKCCPAIVTRVMSIKSPALRPPLQLEEHVQFSGNSKAQHPTGGWPHGSDAPTASSSWHLRAECPDGR